ncbi:HPP family-domain-containing protein [Dactylonectria macrodidyma]|uniref:HPP family-domain-containing protein n=1 Tax=Dactylonectria macrodidyma TaxID=307937 RepID=A0A9P9IL00_9HYPO|nr:HPP family-domain-containing protein [Dactylonectria macrodidyma]
MSAWNPMSWRFDIDRLLNPYIPPPPWQHMPYPVAHLLGHRKEKPRDIGNVVPIMWAFAGVFCAISVIEVVSERIPEFKSRGAPVIVGSFGAGAVLEFYAIESPLAQPRNFFAGQMLAAVLGMGICKLFQMSVHFAAIRWVGGAVSCATVTALMALTKTVHPPAGATALLAVVDDQILHLGWFFIPVVMLNCGIMFAVALLINNVQRTFPSYWWTPEDLRQARKPDAELSDEESSKGAVVEEEMRTEDGSEPDHDRRREHEVVIRPGRLVLPSHIYVTPEEIQLLEEIGNRL